MRSRARSSWAVLVLFLLTMCFRSPRVSAQPVAGWEAAAGFESLADPQDRVTLLGWTADAAFAAKAWLWAVVETGRATRTVELVTLRQAAVLGGMRARAEIGPFVEFDQLVAGAARSSAARAPPRIATTSALPPRSCSPRENRSNNRCGSALSSPAASIDRDA